MTPLTHLIVVPLLLALQCCVAPAVLCSPAPQRSEAPKDARAGRDAEHRGDKAAASSSSASSPPLWRHPLLWGSALFSAGYGARAFFHDGKHGAALRRMQAQLDSQQAQALQQQTERARMRLIHLMLADVYLKNCVLLRKLDLNTATPKTATTNGLDINKHVLDCATLTEANIAGVEPFPDVPIALWDLVPPGTQVKVPEPEVIPPFPPLPLPNPAGDPAPRQERPTTDSSTSAMSMQQAWRYAKHAAVAPSGTNLAPRVRQRKAGVPFVRGAPSRLFAFGARRRF